MPASPSSTKAAKQVDYVPIHPDDFGQEARLQVTITPVFPQPFRKPLLRARWPR